MASKDIKLHYNKAWQAVTDVAIWGYRYANLLKDISRHFIPSGAAFPELKIEGKIGEEYMHIVDDESLTRCLVLGGPEVDIYVDVVKVNNTASNGVSTNSMGYYVEEVDDDIDVVVLDSEDSELEALDETVEEDVAHDIQFDNVNWEEFGVEEDIAHDIQFDNVTSDNVQFDFPFADAYDDVPFVQECNVEAANDNVQTADVDGVSDYGEISDSDCELSTDAESGEDGPEYEETRSGEGAEESDSEDSEYSDNRVSEDEWSGVEGDGENMEPMIDDPELERQIMQVNRQNAGTWFTKEANGSIKLRAGHLFVNIKEFRDILVEYVIQEGFEMVKKKNEKSRVTAVCKSEGCPWRVHASPTGDGETFKIKT